MSRVGLLICLFFVSGLLLFWNPFWSFNQPKNNTAEQELQPDFVALDMTLRQFNQLGFLASEVHAKQMLHFDSANITEFTKPSYIIYPNGGAAKWKISADIGVFNQRDHVVLKNNVIISSIASTAVVKTITTSRVEIDLTTMMVTSKQPIKVIGEKFHITGVGLKADLNQQQIELIKDIQAVYDNIKS